MKLNDDGLKLIKSFEGCCLKAYKDMVGVITIGYGHTGADVSEGQIIDEDQALALLQKDLEKFENGVSKLVTCELTDNQFSALVSFSYNLGLGSLKSSTLLKCVNSGDFDQASNEFLKWDKAASKVSSGLLRRRTAESELFSRS